MSIKVLHLNTMLKGGAGTAALRLHKGLQNIGVASSFCCAAESEDPKIISAIVNPWHRWYGQNIARLEYHTARLLHPSVRPPIPLSLFFGFCRHIIKKEKPDVVNLHWVENGFVSIRDLRWFAKNIPLIWTLHDMSPMSGGFSYRELGGLPPDPFGSLKMTGKAESISSDLIRRKTDALKNAKLTIVSPSEWLANEARKSQVFSAHPIECIPNGIDLTTFPCHSKAEAKMAFDLPPTRKVILFGAEGINDPRKGAHHLLNAVRLADKMWDPSMEKPVVALFGSPSHSERVEWPWETRYVGRVSNTSQLSKLYSAADLFICPSREDNLPNTVIESLASGTPVIGFNIGGMPDMIKNDLTGKLVEPYDEKSLADAILDLLSNTQAESERIRLACRSWAIEKFGIDLQARRYLEVYHNSLL